MAWLFVNRWTSPTTPTSLWITLTVSLPLVMMMLLLLPTFTTVTTAQILASDPAMFSNTNNNNNNNYRSKRSLSSGDCSLCFSTQDPIGCQRCLSQNLRRVLDNEGEEEEDQEDVLAVSKKWTYEPMRRYQRGSGCSCCYFSRMTNVNCCSACSMTTKRAAATVAKRSGGMTSGDDALMTSERVRDQGAILGRLNCQCCDVTGDDTCCLGCLLVL